MTDETSVIALDTNALMMPVEVDVRVFDEIERLIGGGTYVVPDAVLEELDRLKEGAGTEAVAAEVGRSLAADRCEPIAHPTSSADDAIVHLAEHDRVDYVVTNDTPLRKRVLDTDIPVISLRGRTKLQVIRP